MISASRVCRMPQKQAGSQKVLNCARCCFYLYGNLLPFRLPSMTLKYPGFLTTFRLSAFHFIFLWQLNSFMWIYPFKRKTLGRNIVFTTMAIHICFASLTLIFKLPFFQWTSLETKILPLMSQMLAFLGTLYIFTIKIF